MPYDADLEREVDEGWGEAFALDATPHPFDGDDDQHEPRESSDAIERRLHDMIRSGVRVGYTTDVAEQRAWDRMAGALTGELVTLDGRNFRFLPASHAPAYRTLRDSLARAQRPAPAAERARAGAPTPNLRSA